MISLKNITYAYYQKEEKVHNLTNVNLEINKGEVVVLCGRSGCGKTTLTRVINGLIPNFYEGELSGEVLVSGQNVTKQPLEETAKIVGSVFQNPRSQFFNIDTTGEIIFGCENIALPKEETRRRLQSVSETFNLEKLLNRSIFELSGGEKQRIACASIYAVQPDVFVFDEPSSNLDVQSVELLRSAIETLVENNKTVIIAEHRLYYLSGLATKYIYMKDGQIEKEFNPEEMLALTEEERVEMGLRRITYDKFVPHKINPTLTLEDKMKDLYIESLHVAYKGNTILDIKDLNIQKNTIVAIIGENGVGKSTFAKAFAGLIKAKGKVFLDNKKMSKKQRLSKSFMVMQDVNHQLFTESVLDEVGLNLADDSNEHIQYVLNSMSLNEFSNKHPQSLSGGQKQRVAIASALCARKDVLIFDEPTSGQDYNNMQKTCEQITEIAKDALCTLVITHDIEFLLNCCDRVIRLDECKVCEDYILDEEGSKRIIEYYVLSESLSTQ